MLMMELLTRLAIVAAICSSAVLVKYYFFDRVKAHAHRPTDKAASKSRAHVIETDAVEGDEDPMMLYAQIKANRDTKALSAIEFIKSVLRQYSVSRVAFSFNGGKDCTVLLYLIRIALRSLGKQDADLPIIWFQRSDEFPEMIEFLRFCVQKYQFALFETCSDYKNGLDEYLRNGNPQCAAGGLRVRRRRRSVSVHHT